MQHLTEPQPAGRPGPVDAPRPVARAAVPSDAAELVRLRAEMFAALGIDAAGRAWRRACEDDLRYRIGRDDCIAAVVDAPEGGLAASGIVEVLRRIPSPDDPGGLQAYISSVCTDPTSRRQGLARLVMTELLAAVARRGIRRVELHASASGRPLYAELGFVERRGGLEMLLAPGSAPQVSRRAG